MNNLISSSAASERANAPIDPLNAITPADVERACTSVDTWVLNQRALFNPFGPTDATTSRLLPKAFCELATYTHVAETLLPPHNISSLCSHVSDIVNEDRFITAAMGDPLGVHLYLLPVAYVYRRGQLRASVDQAVRGWVRHTHLWYSEKPSVLWLALWYFCKLFRLRRPPRDIVDIVKLSYLTNRLSCCDSTQFDAYDLTHEVFYISDFGCASRCPVEAPQLTALFSALILRSLAEHNLDLALELVAAACIFSQLPRQILLLVFDVVLKQLGRDGRLISPSWKVISPVQASESFKQWAKSYHTMLVAGIACRLVLTRWNAAAGRAMTVSGKPGELALLGRCIAEVAANRLDRGDALLQEFKRGSATHEWSATVSEVAESLSHRRRYSSLKNSARSVAIASLIGPDGTATAGHF